jgi:hypothetical protein
MSEELHRSIGRIEGRLDAIIELLKDRNTRDDDHKANVDKRVAAVERRQAWYSGAAAAVGAVVAVLVKH